MARRRSGLRGVHVEHVHRIKQVLSAARNRQRHVAIIGRSMIRNAGIADDLGYLNVPPGLVLSVDEVDKLPDDGMLVPAPGHRASRRRAEPDGPGAAQGLHPRRGRPRHLRELADPGNESAVYRLIDRLAYAGVDVITRQQAPIHVSGHAAAGELTGVLNALRPRNFMPVHGEGRHLRAHAKIAMRVGVTEYASSSSATARWSTWVTARAVVGRVSAGFTYVDGGGVGEWGGEPARPADPRRRGVHLRRGRRRLAVGHGRRRAGDLRPRLRRRGCAARRHPAAGRRRHRQLPASGPVDPDELRRVIRRSIGSQVNRVHRRRPMILVYVVET